MQLNFIYIIYFFDYVLISFLIHPLQHVLLCFFVFGQISSYLFHGKALGLFLSLLLSHFLCSYLNSSEPVVLGLQIKSVCIWPLHLYLWSWSLHWVSQIYLISPLGLSISKRQCTCPEVNSSLFNLNVILDSYPPFSPPTFCQSTLHCQFYHQKMSPVCLRIPFSNVPSSAIIVDLEPSHHYLSPASLQNPPVWYPSFPSFWFFIHFLHITPTKHPPMVSHYIQYTSKHFVLPCAIHGTCLSILSHLLALPSLLSLHWPQGVFTL